MIIMLQVIPEEVFCSTFRVSFQRPQRFVSRILDNAHFESPKEKKSINDTQGDLAGIYVKSMALIPISCSIFSRKDILDCDMWLLACFDEAIKGSMTLWVKICNFIFKKLKLKNVFDSI